MTTASVPTPSPKVLFTEIDDGTGVLLHLDTKFYYTLNATGVVVWKALADRSAASTGAIADRIVAAFRVEREVAERDVAALIAELLDGGLVIAK